MYYKQFKALLLSGTVENRAFTGQSNVTQTAACLLALALRVIIFLLLYLAI